MLSQSIEPAGHCKYVLFFAQSIYGHLDHFTLSISGSTFVGYSAEQSGGAIRNRVGSNNIVNSTFVEIAAYAGPFTGNGGAIHLESGSVSLISSATKGNFVDNDGDGIVRQGGVLTITNSFIAENETGIFGHHNVGTNFLSSI